VERHVSELDQVPPTIPTRPVVLDSDVAPTRVGPVYRHDLDSWADTFLVAALVIVLGILVVVLGS